MAIDEALEKTFLQELEALEKFRISYTGLHQNLPLDREDPDVRRLIEALGFFTARTRLASERSLTDSLLRMFRQHFPYVLSPMPPMAMLRGATTARFVDPVEIPVHTEVGLDDKSSRGSGAVYRFRTLAPLRLFPIELVGAHTLVTRGKGARIVLLFESPFPRNDDLGELALHVNHLNDLYASQLVLYALKTHLRRVTLVTEKSVKADTPGEPCQVRLGAIAKDGRDLDVLEHPVQRFRAFVQLPQAELYLNVSGLRLGRNWQSFALCLDVDEDWPADLKITADTFELHTVPMINLRRDLSDPIECDGTKERYSVHHPESFAGYAVHSVVGVYSSGDKGMVPIAPTVLGGAQDGYDVLFEGEADRRRCWLSLSLQDAFEKPRRVAVEAFFYQPGIAKIAVDTLRVRLFDRHVEGIDWQLSGSLSPPQGNALERDRDGLLALLSIKNQRFVGTDDLRFLLRSLGVHERREFARIVSALSNVHVRSRPSAKSAGGLCHVYELTFEELTVSDLPRLDPFCSKLLDLLAVWSVEQVVAIVAKVPRLGKELSYPSNGRS
jgi:type VI secretion system protein ImpG